MRVAEKSREKRAVRQNIDSSMGWYEGSAVFIRCYASSWTSSRRRSFVYDS